MKTLIAGLALVAMVSAAFAQQANEPVQRSSSPSGVRIQEGGPMIGGGSSSAAGAPTATEKKGGQDSAVQAGSGTVQIQGNTAIKANVRNLNSAAVGVNNAARNEVGAIGK